MLCKLLRPRVIREEARKGKDSADLTDSSQCRNTVSQELVDTNPDFQFYKQQKELWQKEKNIDSLRGAKNPEKNEELAAWTLDKYKFIHVLEKTWAMAPDMDWYFFIDADTYLICM